METSSTYKIYPSSSGFVSGQGVIAEYNSACPRYIVISQGADKKDLDPVYAKVGLIHENWHAEALGSLLKAREVPIKFEIVPEVFYSGRCDFITIDDEIHETKASLSKNFLYSVIRKGRYKTSHLAQLVSYLIHFKMTKGKIITGFYEAFKSPLGTESFTLKESRIFKVEIDDQGNVLVDSEYSGYTVIDQYKHSLLIAEILKSREIKDRPSNYIDFSGPCTFCPLKNLCGDYDKGDITDTELRALGLLEINRQPIKTFKFPEKKPRSTK